MKEDPPTVLTTGRRLRGIVRSLAPGLGSSGIAVLVGVLTYRTQHDPSAALVAAILAGMTALSLFFQMLSK